MGLYLVGSHALGDVRPGSDIDFVGVLHRPPVRVAELAGVPDLMPWIADRVAWISLGIPRLLASIEAGDVLSKTEAGQVALARFPEWRPVLEASLAQHHEPRDERLPVLAAMAPDAVAFGRRCIEVALAGGGGGRSG